MRVAGFALKRHAIRCVQRYTCTGLGSVRCRTRNAFSCMVQLRKSFGDGVLREWNLSNNAAVALLTNHKPEEAVAESEREPDPQYRLMVRPIALDAAGRNRDAEQELAELKLRYGEENADWIALNGGACHSASAISSHPGNALSNTAIHSVRASSHPSSPPAHRRQTTGCRTIDRSQQVFRSGIAPRIPASPGDTPFWQESRAAR